MAHLVCTEHKKRVMVLSDNTTIHRETNKKCDTKTVRIGDRFYYIDSSLISALKHGRKPETIDLTRINRVSVDIKAGVTAFTTAITKAGAAIGKFAEAYNKVHSPLTPEERLLQDIKAMGDADIVLAKCPVCGEDAVKDKSQDNTIYCDNCEFMGRDALSVSLRAMELTEGEIAEIKRKYSN